MLLTYRIGEDESMSTISLCMIVKDEEKNIRRCLESARDIVDEIIIADTGSSDRTKEICLEYGAKVFDFEWKDNFAQARNFSIEKASSDWILWMDADMELQVREGECLKDYLEKEKKSVYSVKMLHVSGAESLIKGQYYTSYNYLLFRNGLNLHFQGSIHEKLVFDLDKEEEGICGVLGILHYGYSDEAIAGKAIRNLRLLVREQEEGSKDPWLDYHIAAELYRLKETDEALLSLDKAIARFLLQGVLPPALIYRLKYEILLRSDRIEIAFQGIEKAVELYPDYVELHFLRGILLYRREEYERAIKAFIYCIVLGEESPGYLIKAGSGSFYAYYYMGECYTKLGFQEAAQEAYRQSALWNPEFEPAKARLKGEEIELTSQEIYL
ncbi:glycosyltransferase involved in cell wall biosynthesis [Anaerotaenia torta]|uniref:glycosyltransferase family 2 protein n=1 Tax=Anaerotaenia torta TaxID=433293 RepID=UPI003D1D9925